MKNRKKRIAAIALVGVLTFLVVTVAEGVVAQAAELGDSGTEVTELQKDLRELGYVGVIVDGQFGPRTQRAVIHFQRANRLRVDGIAGPITTARIDKAAQGTAPAVRDVQTQIAPAPTPAPSASGPCAEWADELAFFSPGWDVGRMQQIMYRESRCQPGARNRSGASGLLQIMPLHVPNLGPCEVYSAADLLDAGKNICSAAIVYRRAGGMSPWALR